MLGAHLCRWKLVATSAHACVKKNRGQAEQGRGMLRGTGVNIKVGALLHLLMGAEPPCVLPSPAAGCGMGGGQWA